MKQITMTCKLHEQQLFAIEDYMKKKGIKTVEEAMFSLFEDGLQAFADEQDDDGV